MVKPEILAALMADGPTAGPQCASCRRFTSDLSASVASSSSTSASTSSGKAKEPSEANEPSAESPKGDKPGKRPSTPFFRLCNLLQNFPTSVKFQFENGHTYDKVNMNYIETNQWVDHPQNQALIDWMKKQYDIKTNWVYELRLRFYVDRCLHVQKVY